MVKGQDPLTEVSALLARGFLRLLAQRSAGPPVAPSHGNPVKPVDSVRTKSVNWDEHEGERHA